jgi:hypothetical protein
MKDFVAQLSYLMIIVAIRPSRIVAGEKPGKKDKTDPKRKTECDVGAYFVCKDVAEECNGKDEAKIDDEHDQRQDRRNTYPVSDKVLEIVRVDDLMNS